MNVRFMLNAVVQLFYPSVCYACDINEIDENEMICMGCIENLPYTKFEMIKENPTEKLFWGRIQTSFACCIFYFEKDNMLQVIIHQIKYRNEKKTWHLHGKIDGIETDGYHTRTQD